MASRSPMSFIADQDFQSLLHRWGILDMVRHLHNNLPKPSSLLWIAALAVLCPSIWVLTLRGVRFLSSFHPREDRTALCWFIISGGANVLFLGLVLVDYLGILQIQDLANPWAPFRSGDVNPGSDIFVLCFQVLTNVMLTLLSFAAVLSIIKQTQYRHPLQVIVCAEQLHSMILQCGVSLTSHLLKTPRNSKDVQVGVFQIAIICCMAIIPGILLQSSMETIVRVLNGFSKISSVLSNRRNPTPMKPRPRNVSTATITVSSLDFGSQKRAGGESANSTPDSNYPSLPTPHLSSPITPSLGPKQRLNVRRTRGKSSRGNLRSENHATVADTKTSGRDQRGKLELQNDRAQPMQQDRDDQATFPPLPPFPPYPKASSTAPSTPPPTVISFSPSSSFSAPSPTSSPTPKTPPPHTPLKALGIYDKDGFLMDSIEEESDESLGEIIIDKTKVLEGIKQRAFSGGEFLEPDVGIEE